jgi:alkylation response protein AidB-like acyl-CoA dehydrogenase
MALTDRSKGKGGISAFAVPMDTPGIRAGKKENKLGMRASDTSTILIEECRVPADALIGETEEGFRQALTILDGGRIGIAALAIGMARGAFEAALRYAQQRRQFGRALSEFEAIQFYLAEMATDIEADSLLARRLPRRATRARRWQKLPRWRSTSPAKCASASPTGPSRSTADTVSSRTIPSRSSTATSSSARSARDDGDPEARDRAADPGRF